MMVIPAKKTNYQDMIQTMDAARNMERQARGKKRKIPLFPGGRGHEPGGVTAMFDHGHATKVTRQCTSRLSST